MTDYKAEQADEVESLESIFPEELEVVSPSSLILPISVEVGSHNEVCYDVLVNLKITYPETYPDVAPGIEIEGIDGCDEETEKKLHAVLVEEAEQCLGDAMVFSLHARAVEWLEETATAALEYAQKEQERKIAEETEAEIARLTAGTVVTKESFAVWKEAFNAEMKSKEESDTAASKSEKVLTGRQLFEKNKKMVNSEDTLRGKDDVVVDTSVFESLDIGDIDDVLDD
eukprot:m.2913 g.2913  ORF g.2913 m.2913 type:complete len:228 (+) comp2617_c0_seq1:149-832(+)